LQPLSNQSIVIQPYELMHQKISIHTLKAQGLSRLKVIYHHQQQMRYGQGIQGLHLTSLGWVNFKHIWFDDGR
jgi:MarR-like DNA-binding transcriptional regulator SgrR of sgrS sRNA